MIISDKTTNMQFSRMQNKIYGSLVTMQYHTNVQTLFTQSSQAKNLTFIFFAANLYLCSNSDLRQVFTPIYQ